VKKKKLIVVEEEEIETSWNNYRTPSENFRGPENTGQGNQ
jgi:hypothetical protein